MENTEKRHGKSRFWLGFSIGLMAGLVFAVVFYFVDKSLNGPIQLLVSPPASESAVIEEAPAEEEPANPYVGKKLTAKTVASPVPSADTLDNLVEDSILMDDEFSLDQTDGPELVYHEKCLAQRTITVKSNDGSSAPITAFEVEEWSESTVNKISYYRKNNVLKIKGLKIQNIKIIFHQNQYYIEYNGRYYPIPENEDFHRLAPVALP